MLYSTGHGGKVVPAETATGLREAAAPFDAAQATPVLVPAPRKATMPKTAMALESASGGAFRYYFPGAPAFPATGTTLAALDALGDSMFDPANPSPPVSIPPILTYFGQFIDHDITANTDRKVAGLSEIDGTFLPTARADVMAGVDNLRDGSLGLDSLYGDSVGQDPFSAKLAGLMRHPTLKKKMRLGVPVDVGDGQITPPADNATDLLRLGFLLDRGDLTEAELNALPPDQRDAFFKNGNVLRQRAILGDFRNDENLLIAQLQVAFLRFHNKLADLVPTFEEARKLTRYHYQWLVAHEYLPSLCDRSVVDELIATGSPMYGAFYDANVPTMAPKMPMPLEFSAACFRFGHTMVRGRYDHNRVFGRAEPGKPNREPFAKFEDLFNFTGDGEMKKFGLQQLPNNWVIDWSRFVNAENQFRSAKGIDTLLDKPLDLMANQQPPGLMQHLAKRNLRRGYRLNLPSAQECIAGINATGHFRPITAIDPTKVMEGRSIAGVDFGNHTPLWFYILREAELLGSGHLGPLGTHIVAGTLLGLIIKDQTSYWNDTSAGHRWSPSTFRPGAPIDSLKAMLRFTGQLTF